MTSRPTTPRAELRDQLQTLRLTRTADELDDFVARTTRRKLGPHQVLEEMAQQEIDDRERRSLERRMRSAKLGHAKPMDDFDWTWPTKIDRPAIERALSGDLVRAAGNLILVAAQGLGKTLLARNIARAAVLQGHSALFVEASAMLLDLGGQESARALERRLRHYARPALLCIDEIGYLSYDARAADLLFQVVSRRYERRSVVVTTNLAFRDWTDIFPNASCVTALIDRLTHHADICRIEGDSYRRREAEVEQARRRAPTRRT